MDAVRQANRTKGSIAQDKVATPPEPAKVTEDFVHALSPTYIVAERNTRSQANIAENYKTVFSDFGDLNEIRARATIRCLTVANSFAGSVRLSSVVSRVSSGVGVAEGCSPRESIVATNDTRCTF